MQTPESSTGTFSVASGSEGRREYVTRERVSKASEQKLKSVTGALRAALPKYDTIVETLSKNGSWWSSFRQKTVSALKQRQDSLLSIAPRAYTSNKPAVLGLLVTAYARSSQRNHHLYVLVDRLVISDHEYASTVEGLECLLLLGKCFTDIGQPRRAWYLYRRGLAIAQLMVWRIRPCAPGE